MKVCEEKIRNHKLEMKLVMRNIPLTEGFGDILFFLQKAELIL